MDSLIRVLLADDHRVIRHGLRAILEAESRQFEVIAEAEDGRSAVQLARELAPDVVVMDVSMSDMNGIEATRRIVEADQRLRVVALSMHREWRFVGAMLKAGAVGYLCKDCAAEDLVRALLVVTAGHTYFSSSISDVLVSTISDELQERAVGPADLLSGREREVLQLMAEGHSTKEIAWHLKVSPKTIETHRRHIMAKLGIDSIAGLTRYAISEGLTPL